MTAAEENPTQVLRIVDASLNRVGEGLRILEDIARLLLNDAALTEQLKAMRHDLTRGSLAFNRQLIQSRRADADVGMDAEVPDEDKKKELPQLLVANAKRVQESLRTLEEMAKLPGASPELDAEKFKHARFNLYTLEQNLMARLLRQDKLKKITGLYVIIDTQVLKEQRLLEASLQVIKGGANVIQLRDKILSKRELLPLAHRLRDLCAEHDVLFIMNDYLDLALETDADGLHVGPDDLPVEVARRLLPADKILGVSARTVEEATMAQMAGADYLGIGAMYATTTKSDAVVVGPERLRQVRQALDLPLVAIGGITAENTEQLIGAGADSVAVISAVLNAKSPETAARQITRKFERER